MIELDGRPFDVRREVDQIYLHGDFFCVEDHAGFRPAPPQPLGLGSWRRLGHPFYDRETSYTFALPETSAPATLVLDDEDWHGSFILVEVSGEIVARL